MGVDQTSLDRIRNATFPSSRRGYDKREVEKFLARLADWLETGAGDESRSDTVKRELERVGQRTGAILSQAEESAQQIRGEAEEQARGSIAEADAAAEETRAEAETYSKEKRGDADSYAKETRATADADASEALSEADREAADAIEQAQAQARRIVEEGNKRRQDIELVIADLVGRRDSVLTDIDELGGKLGAAVSEHRPADGADPFSEPADYDPQGEAEEVAADALPEESFDQEEEVVGEEPEEAPADADPGQDEAGAGTGTDAETKTPRKPAKRKKAAKPQRKDRRRSRSSRVKT